MVVKFCKNDKSPAAMTQGDAGGIQPGQPAGQILMVYFEALAALPLFSHMNNIKTQDLVILCSKTTNTAQMHALQYSLQQQEQWPA